MSDLDQLINKTLKTTNYSENPYFLGLKNGEFEREDFLETQIQFYFAVIFFSRPMTALAARIPSQKARIGVLRNIWEEHGEGQLSHAHGNTFLQFLHQLGKVDIQQVKHRGLWPEVRIFNTALIGAAVLDDFLISVSIFGMIERMFVEISSLIRNGVIKNSWIGASEMVHYKLHSELDIKHAQDFFEILASPFSKNDENKYYIEQGLKMGAMLFNDLYFGLWKARKRRWILNTSFPPSKI